MFNGFMSKKVKGATSYLNNLKCDHCGRVFHKEFGLQSHMKIMHRSGARPSPKYEKHNVSFKAARSRQRRKEVIYGGTISDSDVEVVDCGSSDVEVEEISVVEDTEERKKGLEFESGDAEVHVEDDETGSNDDAVIEPSNDDPDDFATEDNNGPELSEPGDRDDLSGSNSGTSDKEDHIDQASDVSQEEYSTGNGVARKVRVHLPKKNSPEVECSSKEPEKDDAVDQHEACLEEEPNTVERHFIKRTTMTMARLRRSRNYRSSPEPNVVEITLDDDDDDDDVDVEASQLLKPRMIDFDSSINSWANRSAVDADEQELDSDVNGNAWPKKTGNYSGDNKAFPRNITIRKTRSSDDFDGFGFGKQGSSGRNLKLANAQPPRNRKTYFGRSQAPSSTRTGDTSSDKSGRSTSDSEDGVLILDDDDDDKYGNYESVDQVMAAIDKNIENLLRESEKLKDVRGLKDFEKFRDQEKDDELEERIQFNGSKRMNRWKAPPQANLASRTDKKRNVDEVICIE